MSAADIFSTMFLYYYRRSSHLGIFFMHSQTFQITIVAYKKRLIETLFALKKKRLLNAEDIYSISGINTNIFLPRLNTVKYD